MTKRQQPKTRQQKSVKLLRKKIMDSTAKNYQKAVKEAVQQETDNLKIAEAESVETIEEKNELGLVITGPLANPSMMDNYIRLTGLNTNERLLVKLPIQVQPKEEVIKVSEETIEAAIERETEKETKKEKEIKDITDTVKEKETENKTAEAKDIDTAEKTTETTDKKTTEKTKTEEPINTDKKETKESKNVIKTKSGKIVYKKNKLKESSDTKAKYITPPRANTDFEELTNALKIVLKYISTSKSENLKIYNGIHDADLETTDLLHEIELNQLDIKEQVEMYMKLKEVRERRRTYKNRQAYFDEIGTFVGMMPGLPGKLQNLLNKLQEVKMRQENAIYTPRIRTDIKESENIKYPTRKK